MRSIISSDLHFWHRNISKFCPETRPFNSVEEMNAFIIKKWNDLFNNGYETFYHLGDFCWGGPEKTRAILEQLPGEKIFILGNHDASNENVLKQYGRVYHYREQKVGASKTPVVLFHYPIESWNKYHHGSVHLHGHTHGSIPRFGRRMDVGWDATEFRPEDHGFRDLEQVVDYLKSKDIKLAGDHHKGKNA